MTYQQTQRTDQKIDPKVLIYYLFSVICSLTSGH